MKTAMYEQDQKKFNILQTRNGKITKYVLEGEILNKFHEIMTKKRSPSHETSVNEKLEALQAQIETLYLSNEEVKMQIKLSNDEIKKLLQQILAEQ